MSRVLSRVFLKRVVLSLLLVGSMGCVAGAKLREDAKLAQKKIANARERGAYRCAPAELARAEAHLEFLNYELSEGDFRRAQWHNRLAQENIDRALEITNPDECADKTVIIMAGPGDRDGDGILDDIDQCPDEPEDFDGFMDDDGCPDLDNDNDGILDANDECPNEAGDIRFKGCPRPDRDGDGIPDILDQCPDAPEDYDGFMDEDGCPDPDNDGDGILDTDDLCPNEAGPSPTGCPVRDRDGDGIPDDIDQCPDVPGLPPTGCPKKVLVVKTGTQIKITQQINFETGKATIKGAISFEILDQVSAVLKSNPDIKIIIEGHTDNVGKAATNLKLSDDRANSVRMALIERGVDGTRMEAKGYGMEKPIASNNTKAGRAENRRVEFNIVQTPAPKEAVAPVDSIAPMAPPPPPSAP